MLLQICGGRVEFAATIILENVNFEIKNKNEKIAVVGRNGSGKTTLLKLISGEVELTKYDGEEHMAVVKAPNTTIGYLKQITFEDETLTLEEEIRKIFKRVLDMKARMEELVTLLDTDHSEELIAEYTRLQEQFQDEGGYFYEKEYDIMLKSFGFTMEDKKKPLNEFSGGQRTKLAFIKMLLMRPDILLLDEPTNHLDITAIEWLEKYLKNYNKAVVVVSHDRMFLDKFVDTVYEIEYQGVKRYNGNYSAFMAQKRANYEKQMKDYIAQQKEIERLNAIVEKFKNKPTKVSMTRSKLKAIEHMDKIEAPDRYDNKTFHASFLPAKETGKDVLFVNHLQIGYDSVLSEVSFDLKRGERLGILGGNGLGKSTLLKTLVGLLPAISGEYTYGTNVELGYFDQQMAQYKSEKTVLDDFWDLYPELVETEVRNCLGAFLFSGEDVFKKVSMLSGGERVRLALAKIFKASPNVLVLDEPTNHMDIIGKETLEAMLKDFAGTVIFVSHDRYFVKQVSTKLLVMNEDGSKLYPFGYEQYIEELERADGLAGSPAGGVSVTKSAGSAVQEKPAEAGAGMLSYQAGKEKSKIERRLKKIEELLAGLEEEIETMKDSLLNPEIQSDYVKLSEIQAGVEAKEEEVLELMAEWDELDGKLHET